jgi:8-oxo-dGTP pyrophosphatase MutT (NUDIX family)
MDQTTEQAPTILSVSDIRHLLTRPLPGAEAQMRMAPQRRVGGALDTTDPAARRQGGVLILLFPRSEHMHFVLTRRTDQVAHHKGQISLPGGTRQDNERLAYTALRETGEELGIPTADVEIVGRLSPLFVPTSDYCVHPFVGYLAGAPTFRPNPVEVAEVLEVSLASLLDPAARKVEYWQYPGSEDRRRVPFFSFQGWVVWGATAMILSEMVTVMDITVGN